MPLSEEEISRIEEEERVRAEARLKYSKKREEAERKKTSSVTIVIGFIVIISLILSYLSKSFIPLFFVLIPIIYFMPTIISYEKNKRNSRAILLLNFFLGWTIVGWIIALIWSNIKD